MLLLLLLLLLLLFYPSVVSSRGKILKTKQVDHSCVYSVVEVLLLVVVVLLLLLYYYCYFMPLVVKIPRVTIKVKNIAGMAVCLDNR